MGCLKLAYHQNETTLKVVRGGKFFEQKNEQRFIITDPKGQGFSPYIAMGNEPSGKNDPDGGDPDWVKSQNGDWTYAELNVTADNYKQYGFVDYTANGSIIDNTRINGGDLGKVFLGYSPTDYHYATPSEIVASDFNHLINSFSGAPALPLSIPRLYPLGEPATIIPFNPASEAEVGMLSNLGLKLTGLVGALLIPSPIAPATVPQPWPGHGNDKRNWNRHIVYEFTYMPNNLNASPTLKYGISDLDRYDYDRPEAQLPKFVAKYPGQHVNYFIVATVPSREMASIIEQHMVNLHFRTFGKMPIEQKRPLPSW
jgi:hypothetical protein